MVTDLHYYINMCSLLSSDVLTLSADGLRHQAGVSNSTCIYGSDDEDVDGVGAQVFDRVLCAPHMVSYSLPTVAHQLAANIETKM